MVICAATNPFGMSWERDNTILFGHRTASCAFGRPGGTPELVIRAEKGEQGDRPATAPRRRVGALHRDPPPEPRDGTRPQIVVQSLRSGHGRW